VRQGKASELAAEAFSVSARYIEQAKQLLATDRELFEDVRSGRVGLSQLARSEPDWNVHWRITLEYELPGTNQTITRSWTLTLGPEALDPGAIMLNAQAIGKFIHRTLSFEGWPRPER
jgi:hypothetical protein